MWNNAYIWDRDICSIAFPRFILLRRKVREFVQNEIILLRFHIFHKIISSPEVEIWTHRFMRHFAFFSSWKYTRNFGQNCDRNPESLGTKFSSFVAYPLPTLNHHLASLTDSLERCLSGRAPNCRNSDGECWTLNIIPVSGGLGKIWFEPLNISDQVS